MLDYKIYTFLTLCKTMNYRVTAEKLNMTQPAVTNHIKQLENEYGCRLFIYKNRVLYMTKQAKILEAYAKSAKYNSQELIKKLSQQEKEILRIGATRTIGEYIINKQITELMLQENINLNYIINNTDSLLAALQEGKLDYVFIEGFLNKENYSHYTYKKEEFVGICSPNHKFAGNSVSLEQLFDNRLILREKGSGTREAFTRLLTDSNYTLKSFKSTIETNSFKAITEFVLAGVGISLVYESVAKNTPGACRFKIKGIQSFHEFTCVHLKNTPKPKFIENFLK